MNGQIFVELYRIWHGQLRLKGAGRLLTTLAQKVTDLKQYKLQLSENQSIEVDFRDVSAMYWLNHQLGDPYEEKGLLIAIRKHLADNDTFWDVGANSGLLSYSLLKEKLIGEVHMFEPNPKMSKLAHEAVSPFGNAHVHAFGLSACNNNFNLTVPHGHTTMGTLEPESTDRHGILCNVECRVGDDLVFKDGYTPPRVIKIDTEGHEMKVIVGLSRIIDEFRPVVFFEHFSINIDQATSLMPEGYSLHTVSDSSGELIPGIKPNAGHNAVFVPKQ